MDTICQFNELLQSKNIHSYMERNTVTQYNESPGWTVELSITVFDKNYFGKGTANIKKDAKRIACTQLISAYKNPVVEELLLIGGIESNPGPPADSLRKSIPMSSVTFHHSEEDVFLFQVGDIKYRVDAQHVKIGKEQMEIRFQNQRDADDFDNCISRLGLRNPSSTGNIKVKVRSYVQQSNVRVVYSNHRNFDPMLRLPVKMSSEIVEQFSGETEGRIVVEGSMTFAPKNILRVNFKGAWYKGVSIPVSLYNQVLNSVKKQTMNKEQLYLMAAQLAVLRMFNLKPADFQSAAGIFWRLYNLGIDLLNRNRMIEVNYEDAWTFIQTQQIYIPTDIFHFGSIQEIFLAKYEHSPLPTFDKMLDHLALYREAFGELTKEEVLDSFSSGLLDTVADEIREFRFEFSAETVPRNMSNKDVPLTIQEQFMRMFIFEQIVEPDVAICFRNSLLKYPEVFEHVIERISKFSFAGLWHDTLSERFKELKAVEVSEFERSDIVNYIVTVRPEYKRFAQRCQLVAQVWSKVLHFDPPQQIFNSTIFVKEVAARKIPSAQATMKLFGAFKEAKDTFVSAMKAGQEGTSFWNDNKQKLSELMKKIESPISPALVNSDFSTFSNSLASCKAIVNQLFYAAVEKIASLLGIEYESPRIDVTTFLFYYLVWKDTTNIGIKTMIIVEVLTSLGIIDHFMKYVGKLWHWIKKLGNKIYESCAGDDLDDETFDSIITAINEKTAIQNDKAAKIFKTTDADEPNPIDDISFIEKVMSYLEKGSPFFLGIAATLLLGSFACAGPLVDLKKCDFLKYGKEIITSARNLSFLGAGLAAIPKIYTHFVAAFKWVVDQVKSIVLSNHQTTYQVNHRAEKWIQETALYSGAIGYTFTNSPETCLKYIQFYSEMNELKKEQLRFTKDIAFAFKSRVKIFEPFFERVRSIMYSNFNLQEMFHVQCYGDPGVGKTDLGDALLRTLKDAYATSRIDFGNVAGGSAAHIMHELEHTLTGFGDVYNMNETLKHLDGYQGQNFIRVDDCNIFQNPEPDAITTQILMLSGTATLANKADLNDKGMVITAKGMISATNNPFIRPDKMLEPGALWRRRILLEVRPHPDFMVKGKMLKGEALDKKFAEKGWDRSKSDHIRVTPLDPDNPRKVPLDSSLRGLTVNQTIKYINAMAKQHYAIEWNRSFTKDPYGAAIRLKFEAIMEKLLGSFVETKDKKEFNLEITKMINNIAENRKISAQKLKEKDKDVIIHDEDVWSDKIADAFRADLSHMADYTIHDNECEALNEIYNLEQLVEEIGNEETMLPEYLTRNEHGEIERVESFHSFKFDVRDDGLDDVKFSEFSKKFVCDITEDDPRMSDKNFTMRLNQNLAYLNSLSKFSADAYLAKHNKKKNIATMTILQKIRLELKYAAAITLRATGQTLRHIMSKVVDYIGKPIIMGMCVTIGLVGLFFSCSMIGQMLAPQQTSYSNPARPLQIFGVNNQKTYLNEEEIPAHHLSQAQSLEKNSFVVTIGKNSFRAEGIQGNIFLINYHSTELIQKNVTAEIFDPRTNITVKQYLSPKDWRRVTKSSGGLITDAALIRLSMVRTPRTIVHRFVTEHDVQNKMVNLRTSNAIPIIYRKDGFINKERYPIIAVESNIEIIPHDRVVAIQMEVELGESGSLFIHDNTMLQGQILGLLTHRNLFTGIAYIGVLTQEEIYDTIKSFEHRDKIIVDHIDTKIDPDNTLATVFKHGQIVKHSHLPSQSISKSLGFKPTPLYGLFPCETVPAIQSEDDPRWNKTRHFLEVSLNKTSGAHFADFTIEEEKFMMSFYEALLIQSVEHLHTVRLYSTQQAIQGVRIPGSVSMDLKNCAGLTYKLERGVVGKSPFITIDARGTYNIQERVFQDVARYENAYIEGIVPQNIKLEFRKKELVGPNKIEDPKTRTVGMGNFIHQIIFMKIFKDLHTLLKTVWANGKSMPFALGVDPEQHWGQIAKHLRYHDYMIDMDVKAWEEKINQRLLYMCDQVELNIIRRSYQSRGDFFPPETPKIAYGLSADYTQCDVAIEDILYEKTAGLLSGHPGTFMRNSAVHTMIIGLAARRILQRSAPQFATIPFIIEHIRFILAADDVVIAVSPLARKYVTVDNLVKAYNEIGFVVTAANKDADIHAKNISEIQFLKHTFIPDNLGSYKCCPNLSIVHQLVNWYRTDSSQSKEKQIADNLDSALRFVWHRSESEYESVRSAINMACKKIKMNYTNTLDYDEMGNLMRLHRMMKERALLSLDPEPEKPDLDYVCM